MAATIENNKIARLQDDGRLPIVLQLRPVLDLDEDQFFQLAQLNRDLRLERNSLGDLIVMTPAGSESGHRNSSITAQLWLWAEQDGTGVVFDSSAGFTFPNQSVHSADSAWVRREIWEVVPPEDKVKFAHLVPDFVIELLSETDSLRVAQDKMVEYIECGVQLGWLIDPRLRRVYVYRLNVPVEELDNPDTVRGDPLLRGFALDLRRVW